MPSYYQGNVLLFQQTAKQMLVYPKLFFFFFVFNIYLLFCLNFYYIVITFLSYMLHCSFCKCFCIALYALFSPNSARIVFLSHYSYFTLHVQLMLRACTLQCCCLYYQLCTYAQLQYHMLPTYTEYTWVCCPQYDQQRKQLVVACSGLTHLATGVKALLYPVSLLLWTRHTFLNFCVSLWGTL